MGDFSFQDVRVTEGCIGGARSTSSRILNTPFKRLLFTLLEAAEGGSEVHYEEYWGWKPVTVKKKKKGKYVYVVTGYEPQLYCRGHVKE